MPDEIKISWYERKTRDPVLDFVRRVYSHVQSAQLIAQWDWKYDANPFTRRAEPHILIAHYEEVIAGMLAAFPLRVFARGKEQWVWNAGDVVVHPQYQRRGIASQLLRTSIECEPYGFGWANARSFRLSTTKRFSFGTRIFPWVKTIFLQRMDNSNEITIQRIEFFDERFDSLWERAQSSQGVMIVRDRAYLHWRFASRPDAAYIVLGAMRGDELLGYLVWRMTHKRRWRVGYLVDWLVDRAAIDVFAPLVKAALAQMSAMGVALGSARTTTPDDQKTLAHLGFRKWNWSRPEYLMTRVNVSEPGAEIFSDPREWRVTMGDGDLEMSL